MCNSVCALLLFYLKQKKRQVYSPVFFIGKLYHFLKIYRHHTDKQHSCHSGTSQSVLESLPAEQAQVLSVISLAGTAGIYTLSFVQIYNVTSIYL